MKTALTVIVTFILTTIWQILATRKGNRNTSFLMHGLTEEMDEMAKALGSSGFIEYLKETKGENYAYNFGNNIIETLKYLEHRN